MTPLTRIRAWIVLFVICLVASGVTAFWLLPEVRWVATLPLPGFAADWIAQVKTILETTHPLVFYGTDWLAFAHIAIALAFIGPYRDPVRNIWVIEWAMLACVAIIPTTLIAGPIRGVPFWWQLIDMSFGVFGLIPLWIVRRQIKRLAATE